MKMTVTLGSEFIASMVAAKGTWLQPEAFAGPLGAMYRKGYALLPDGTLRAVRAGIPDTAMSIPAYYLKRGKRVRGYLTVEDGAFYFHQENP